MGDIANKFSTEFRDYSTDGDAASGAHKPIKSGIRAIGPIIESEIAAVAAQVTSGYIGFATKAALDAALNYDAGQLAEVTDDPTASNNGRYIKSGASGAGSWAKTATQPVTNATYDAEVGEDDGDGTLFARALTGEAGRGARGGAPGFDRFAFTESVTGDPELVSPVAASRLQEGSDGRVFRAASAQVVVARRAPTLISPNTYYEVIYEYRRIVDPADESVSSVARGIRWLKADYSENSPINLTTSADTSCTVASGRKRALLIVGPAGGAVTPDIEIPVGAVMFRPYFQFVGSDHTTDAVILDVREYRLPTTVLQQEVSVTDGRIVVAGDSLSSFHYGPEYKSWIAVLGNLSDWQIDSYSRSGDDTLELLDRLLDGTNDYGSQDFNALRGRYVMIPLFANDSITRTTSTRRYIENFRRLLLAVRAAGAQPIICTEGRKDKGVEMMALSRLAQETGALYWEISGEYFTHDVTRNADYHGNNHPGPRHTHQYKDAFRKFLSTLGRPPSVIKAFRPRYRRQIGAPEASWTFAGESLLSQPDESYVGTLVGDAAIVTDAVRGPVYEATTEGDRMTIGGSYVLPQTYTISAWVQPDALSGSQNIVSGQTTGRHVFLFSGANLFVRHGASGTHINVVSGVTAGQWHHVALTYDASSGEMIAYVDGVAVQTSQSVPNHTSADVQIGASGTSSSLIGRIDDVAIYDRVLNADEIKSAAYHRDSLLFDDVETRAARWREIRTGHHAFTDLVKPYYDELDGLSYAWSARSSEYQTWQAGSTLSFTDYALVQVALPGSLADTEQVTVQIPGATGATIYALNRQRALEGDGYAKRFMFVTSSKPSVSDGDTYTHNSVTYTVQGVTPYRDGSGWVLAATASSDPTGANLGSGTLTRATGTGDSTISFSSTFAYNHEDIYAELYRPYGAWASVTHSSGTFTLSRSSMEGICDYDTLTFLVQKKGAFTLSAPTVTWTGVREKFRALPSRPDYIAGTQLLSDTNFEDFGASDWDTEGTVSAAAPADGVLPYNVTQCVTLSPANRIKQAVTITANELTRKTIQIMVRCRYAPAKFEPNATPDTALVEYDQKSPITEDTLDHAVVVVELNDGDNRFAMTARELVGLAPQDVLVEVEIPNARVWTDTSCELRIWAESPYAQDGETAEIQVYEVRVVDAG